VASCARLQSCTKLSNSITSVTVLTRWRINIPSSQKHSSPFREAFVTLQLCWRCWWRREWDRFPHQTQRTPDLLNVGMNGIEHFRGWKRRIRSFAVEAVDAKVGKR